LQIRDVKKSLSFKTLMAEITFNQYAQFFTASIP
jgi:hypothetical protein